MFYSSEIETLLSNDSIVQVFDANADARHSKVRHIQLTTQNLELY
jgi:hypothetical protein